MGRRRDASLPAEPERAREYLVDVAEECFERYGIRRTTMDDVAARAQVSRPTLYRYFGDRDNLIRTISQRRAARFAGTMETFFTRHHSLRDKLVEGLLHLGEVGRRDPFFGALVDRETVGEVHEILMDSPGAVDFARAVWEPVLVAARERGELAGHVPFPEVYRWLTSVNILLIGWLADDGQGSAGHRLMIESFVVPALVTGTQVPA
jgi:AcrR family transcriptional regulator